MQNTPNFTDLPDSFRNIMRASIEQAQKAFETFVTTSQHMMTSFDMPSAPGTGGLKTLNEKIATFTKENAEANFNLALKLTEARQIGDVVELQNAHVRHQMETFSRQMEELRSLTASAVQEGSKAATSAVQTPLHAAAGHPHSNQ